MLILCQIFAEKGSKPVTSIKTKKLAQLVLSHEPISHCYVLIGMFHSHPDFAQTPIWDFTKTGPEPIVCSNNGVLGYFWIKVPSSAGPVPILACLVKLSHESRLDLTYMVRSTDFPEGTFPPGAKSKHFFIY